MHRSYLSAHPLEILMVISAGLAHAHLYQSIRWLLDNHLWGTWEWRPSQ